jgi:hypothetical protein
VRKSIVIRPAIGTGLLLLVPLVMSILDRNKPEGEGWRWSPLDFAVMGILLFGAGLTYEFFARKLDNRTQRLVLGLVVLCVVLAIWVELAVGGITQLIKWITG